MGKQPSLIDVGRAALTGIKKGAKKEVSTYAKNIATGASTIGKGISAINKWNPFAPKARALSTPKDSGKVGTQRERPTYGGGGAAMGAASAGKASASYGNVAKKAVGAASAKAIPSSNKVSGKVATAGAKVGASKVKTTAKPSKPTRVETRPIATIPTTKTPSNERMQEVVSQALDTTHKVIPTAKESRQRSRGERQERRVARTEQKIKKVKSGTGNKARLAQLKSKLGAQKERTA